MSLYTIWIRDRKRSLQRANGRDKNDLSCLQFVLRSEFKFVKTDCLYVDVRFFEMLSSVLSSAYFCTWTVWLKAENSWEFKLKISNCKLNANVLTSSFCQSHHGCHGVFEIMYAEPCHANMLWFWREPCEHERKSAKRAEKHFCLNSFPEHNDEL